MNYKSGDIVLVKFPFTNLTKSKKRPVLIIKDENDLGDVVCFQITSVYDQSNLCKIEGTDLNEATFKLESYVKYDKCFTITSEIIDKKIAKVNNDFLKRLKLVFCEETFN